MEMLRRGGLGVLCLLCAGVMACVLPQCAGTRADDEWHASSPGWQRHDGAAPAPHYAAGGLPAPPPTAGAETQPAPHFGFPLQPTLGSPTAGEGYPFIGSSPTVPLPTGMTDTATVLPLPDTGGDKVVGLAPSVCVHVSMIGLGVIIFAFVFLSTTCQLL